MLAKDLFFAQDTERRRIVQFSYYINNIDNP